VSAATHTQDKLSCRVVSRPAGLGANDLLLASLHGVEAISQPYRYRVELRSEKPNLSHANIAGQPIGIEVDLEGESKRYFHGFVERFSQGETDERLTRYVAEVVPFLGLLQRRSDSRVFQDLTALEIVKRVIDDAGFAAQLEDATSKAPPKLTYCVQYRESDFAFVSRLLEEEGIVYWFRHFENKHVMVLADGTSGHAKGGKYEFAEKSARTGRLGEKWVRDSWIDTWNAHYEVRSGKWVVKDFDFANPDLSLKAEESTSAKLARFDYPTRHETAARGTARVKLRMEIEEAAAWRHDGTGSVLDFNAGTRFTLDGHGRKDFDVEYLLTNVTHQLQQAIEAGEEGTQYTNSFSCIPASIPYRAPLATPRPVVQGIQTAIVTGPSGEELHVDEHGRVKVQFHWDRVGEKNDKTSCWVRVAQTHASGGFGAAFWPRVGDEVVVSFEEGDPDRPLITGRVYNGKNKPPYKLPDNVTRSAFKTRSTKGGGEATFNELRFEDKKGEEHLFLHAEKDRFEHTKGERHAKVVKDEYLAVDGKQHSEVKGEVVAKFGAAHEVQVTGDRKEQIGGSLHVKVGGDRHTKVTTNEALDAGVGIHLKAGATFVIEAGAQLTLKAGGSFITIGPDGVSIIGVMVKLNSGGAPGQGSGASPQGPAAPAAPKEVPK
jgi:type VI secretion system secreted protein VgrG